MTILNFPSNPTIDQIYAAPNGVNYRYDGVKWTAVAGSVVTNPSQLINGSYQVLLDSNGSLTVPGTIIFPDSSVQETAYRYNAQDTAPYTTAGSLWFNTTDGRLYVNYNNTWVDASPTEIDPNAIRFGQNNEIEMPDGALIQDSGFYAGPGQNAVIGQADGNTQVYTQDVGIGLQTYDGTTYYTWSFDNTGSLTLPGGTTIESEYGGGPRLVLNGNGNYVDIRDSGTILIGYNSTGSIQIGNPAGGADIEILSKKVRFFEQSVPTHSYGAPGDVQGHVAFDGNYIYYCKQDYVNNSTDIWVRVIWTETNW